MSVYGFNYARFQEPEYGPEREYPTTDEIKDIARRHLAPAFYAMAEAIQKAAPRMGHEAFVSADISKMIDYALEDVIDNMDPKFLNACKGDE